MVISCDHAGSYSQVTAKLNSEAQVLLLFQSATLKSYDLLNVLLLVFQNWDKLDFLRNSMGYKKAIVDERAGNFMKKKFKKNLIFLYPFGNFSLVFHLSGGYCLETDDRTKRSSAWWGPRCVVQNCTLISPPPSTTPCKHPLLSDYPFRRSKRHGRKERGRLRIFLKEARFLKVLNSRSIPF